MMCKYKLPMINVAIMYQCQSVSIKKENDKFAVFRKMDAP